MQSSKTADPIKRQRSTSRSASPSPSPREPVPTWIDSSRKKRVTSVDEPAPRTQRNIPAFLNKLYSMVDDASTDDLIRWSTEGNSFIVEQHELFSKTVLPRFYKHNTFSSFVRQLNMYDFHKVPHLQQGVMLVDSEHELWEFSHPNFRRNQYELLHLVVRKRIRNNNDQQQQQPQSQQASPLPTPSLQDQPNQQQLLLGQHLASTGDSSAGQLEYVRLGSLVKDISTIRQHQHAISTDLQHLHNDNEILWRETLLAREKHQRHQQVIERILLFLTSVFANEGNPGNSPNQSRYMMQNQDEKAAGSQAGNLDRIAAPPGRLIEEAAKLAGISTTSLQEKLLDHGIGATSSEIGVSPSPVADQQIPMYHHQQNQEATTLQQQQYQRHQRQYQPQSNNQDQGQDKGKFGMYGKRGMDPSFLMNALNDLYSIRNTSTSISSNPHGMESSAMNPSSSRSEQTSLHSGYHRDDQQYSQLQQHYPQHHMYNHQDHIPTTGSSNMTMVGNSNKHGDTNRTTAALHAAANSIKTSTALAPAGTNPLLGFPNLHTSTALSGLTGNSGGGGGGIGSDSIGGGDDGGGGGGGDNETGDITRIVGLAESLHTATRSAEAISQDIDDLQISIESLAATMGLDTNGAEGFDGYLDEFTDNYNNMISLATKNDKMQLFELAGDSNAEDKYDGHRHTQQQREQQQQHQRKQQHNSNNDSSNNVSSHIDRKFTDISPHTTPNDI